MGANNFTSREQSANGRLRLFSLYLDFPASVRARWANSTISHLAGEDWVVSTEMWKLDSLEAGENIRKMVLQEAARADIVAVVASSLNCRQYKLVQWLETLTRFSSPSSQTGLLMGLFGGDESDTTELSWTVKSFLNYSGRLNRDFIWHWMEAGAMNDLGWLNENLRPFLQRKRLEAGRSHTSALASVPA